MTERKRGPWTPVRLPERGQRFYPGGGEELVSTDPTTGEPVAVLETTSVTGVEQLVERARAASRDPVWRNDAATRGRTLYRYAESLRDQLEPLAELLTREQGKTIGEARSEVLGAADMVEFYAGAARTLYGRAQALGEHAHGVVLREPVGVVGVITPWNWPLTLLVRALAPALAAGNACVVKPASLTAAVTVRALAPLAELLPPGVLGCAIGSGSSIGDALVGNPEVDMIAFTGESSTGVDVLHRAGGDLRKVSLELGGKSPNLVFADAPMDKAVDGALNACFTTTGQICTAGSRLLVEAGAYDEFLDRLARRTEHLVLGDPLLPTTGIGPVVSPGQQRDIESYIELGAREGKILASAALPGDDGLARGAFVSPTLVGELPSDSKLLHQEIFGPVLTVQAFEEEQQGIALAEDSEFGLAAGIWTTDLDCAWRVGRAVSAGTVWINTYHHFYPEAEVGGFRKSGIGRQQGLEGIHEFTETKHLNFDSRPTLW